MRNIYAEILTFFSGNDEKQKRCLSLGGLGLSEAILRSTVASLYNTPNVNVIYITEDLGIKPLRAATQLLLKNESITDLVFSDDLSNEVMLELIQFSLQHANLKTLWVSDEDAPGYLLAKTHLANSQVSLGYYLPRLSSEVTQ